MLFRELSVKSALLDFHKALERLQEVMEHHASKVTQCDIDLAQLNAARQMSCDEVEAATRAHGKLADLIGEIV